MKYHGKLYAKFGSKFIELENSAQDIDTLVDGVAEIHKIAKDKTGNMKAIETKAESILKTFKREIV